MNIQAVKNFLNRFYVKLALAVIILLISLKSIAFTWCLLAANYYGKENAEKEIYYLYQSLFYKPSFYRDLDKQRQPLVRDKVIKEAILKKYFHGVDITRDFPVKELSRKQLQKMAGDNFYFNHFFPAKGKNQSGKQPNNQANNQANLNRMQNLDAVALDFLADRQMNPLTLSTWNELWTPARMDRKFLLNMLDYLDWKGNRALFEYIQKIPLPKDWKPLQKIAQIPPAPTFSESSALLNAALSAQYGIKPGDLGINMLENPAFDDAGKFKEVWEFHKMAGVDNFADGSFIMGLDKTGANVSLRLMGFFVDNQPGKTRARCGVCTRQKMQVDGDYYLFSFDYLTRGYREMPSFNIWKGETTTRIRPTMGQWKKIIFMVDNSTRNFKMLRPYFRMWGTGTLLIDNVRLAEIRLRHLPPTNTTNPLCLDYVPPKETESKLKNKQTSKAGKTDQHKENKQNKQNKKGKQDKKGKPNENNKNKQETKNK